MKLISAKEVTARKEHVCSYSGISIEPGTKYTVATYSRNNYHPGSSSYKVGMITLKMSRQVRWLYNALNMKKLNVQIEDIEGFNRIIDKHVAELGILYVESKVDSLYNYMQQAKQAKNRKFVEPEDSKGDMNAVDISILTIPDAFISEEEHLLISEKMRKLESTTMSGLGKEKKRVAWLTVVVAFMLLLTIGLVLLAIL